MTRILIGFVIGLILCPPIMKFYNNYEKEAEQIQDTAVEVYEEYSDDVKSFFTGPFKSDDK